MADDLRRVAHQFPAPGALPTVAVRLATAAGRHGVAPSLVAEASVRAPRRDRGAARTRAGHRPHGAGAFHAPQVPGDARRADHQHPAAAHPRPAPGDPHHAAARYSASGHPADDPAGVGRPAASQPAADPRAGRGRIGRRRVWGHPTRDAPDRPGVDRPGHEVGKHARPHDQPDHRVADEGSSDRLETAPPLPVAGVLDGNTARGELVAKAV